MAVTPWLANYPWSDPLFQSFNVQQYLTVSGVNPVQTYATKAPEELASAEKPAPKTSRAKAKTEAPADTEGENK